MQTQIIPEQTREAAWLDHVPDDGGLPQRTELDKSPFVVGRSASADLPLNSNRVSREHAVLVRDAAGYRVRDLDSTNGTFLNGRRIQEAPLRDGDVLVVANLEFTFHSARPDGPRNAATQVMALADDEDDAGSGAEAELLRNLRRLHEALVSGGPPCRFEPVVDLHDDRLFGYAPSPDERPWGLEDSLATPAVGIHMARRLRRVQRVRALEQAARLSPDARVFLHVDAAELVDEALADSLVGLCQLLGDPARIVLTLPDGAASVVSVADTIAERLRQAGVAVALRGFTGRLGHPPPLPTDAPDYVLLADGLVRHLPGSAARQTWVRAVVAAGRERGWSVVAPGIRTAEERRWCHELGCAFGQGPWFQRPSAGQGTAASVGKIEATIEA